MRSIRLSLLVSFVFVWGCCCERRCCDNPGNPGVVSDAGTMTVLADTARAVLPVDVKITSTGFSPDKVIVLGGETVRWENTTATAHTVSAQGGGVTLSVGPLAPGQNTPFT